MVGYFEVHGAIKIMITWIQKGSEGRREGGRGREGVKERKGRAEGDWGRVLREQDDFLQVAQMDQSTGA